MKMIRHQAITKNVIIFFQFGFYLLQKIEIIGICKKDRLIVVAPVAGVVSLIGFDMRG